MHKRFLLSTILLLAFAATILAQQAPDLNYNPPIPRPAYEPGAGPRVAIDEAHHNFHTADGRYRPFAELLLRDGYRVDGFGNPFSASSLKAVDVLVIANPLNERNVEDWSLPTPSAFTPDEIAAVRTWVESGGSLFLIADHMPFAGAAIELAKAFGVEFSNGYARFGNREPGRSDIFEHGTGLEESIVTRGRAYDEKVTKIATFIGSAFKPPKGAIPVLVFGPSAVSLETKKAPGITPDAAKVPIEGWCQGAVLKVGSGRVAVFGEAAMFSAQLAGPNRLPIGMNAPEAEQNHQLLLNVMHWLTRAKGMRDRGEAPDLEQRLLDMVEAHNRHDVTRELTFYADDVAYITSGESPIVGKAALRDILQADSIANSELVFKDPVIRGDTVIVDTITERSDWVRFIGISESHYTPGTRMIFHKGLIQSVELTPVVEEDGRANAKGWSEIMAWLPIAHPELVKEAESGWLSRYDAKATEAWMKLFAEWKASRDGPKK